MERRRYTTAGVLFWTPAPDHTSPTSTVVSEDAWEEEDDDEEADGGFICQMDENGIIGLSEALQEAELGETSDDDVLTDCKPPEQAGRLAPEEADCIGRVRDRPPEELSSSLRERLDHSGEVSQAPPPGYDTVSGLKALMEDEQRREELPDGVKYLDMAEEEKCFTSEESGWKKGQNQLISSTRSVNHHPPAPRPASASVWPHLVQFTSQELASSPGIDAETFPEMDITESLPESYCSSTGHVSSSCCLETNLRASPQPAASLSEHVASNPRSRFSISPREGSGKVNKHQKLPVPLPRKTKPHSPESAYTKTPCSAARTDTSKSNQQNKRCGRELRTPRARTDAAEEEDYRRGSPSYHTPDFSQVEPKVHFPKDGYTPPKSRPTPPRKSLSPEPPLVFKSPAEIVKEVLLSNTDEPSLPTEYNTHADAVNSTVPQEFRCREQATALLEQLQEDYNRLLTKYAEAENTIDRLRLEAKVSLYSDPPVAGLSAHSGLNHNLSKYLKLDFSQPRRVEINSTSCPDGHNSHQESVDASPSSRSPGLQLGQQLTNILFSQTDKFLLQLQTFEDLLKSEKLKPLEKVKGLSQLAEGLNSLERGYLLAQDEHRLLQQRGAETRHFDPDRELEGLIFQCGLRVDELKEQIEHIHQEHPGCEAPKPPSPSSLSDEEETPTYTQSPPLHSLVSPGDAGQMEMNSTSKGGDEEEAGDEEALSSLLSRLQMTKHRCISVDHMKEDHRLPPRAASETDMQHGGKEEERQSQRTGKDEVPKTLPKRKAKSGHQDPPAGTSKRWNTKSSPPLCSQSTMLPVLRRSSRTSSGIGKSNSSSLSSIADLATPETRRSKAQTASRRVPSQDGVVSPETDSGFVGSEGSHQIPPAAAGVLHQRASESISGVQDGNSGRPQAGTAAARCPSSSSSPSHMVQESQLSSKQARRARQGPRMARLSCSLQGWIAEAEQNRCDGGAREFRLESVDAVGGSEAEYANSINSPLSSCSSSLPAARGHHGDTMRALSPAQVINYNEAIRTLQAEITSLKEKLESCLRTRRSTSSAQSSFSRYSTSTPRIRSGQRRSDGTLGNRETPTSAARQRARQDSLPGSKMETSTPQPQSQVVGSTQTPAAPDSCCSHTTSIRSRRTQIQPVLSNICPAQLSACSRYCSHCGCCGPHRHTEPDLCKQGPPKQLNYQAAWSPDRAGSRYAAAEEAPPRLQCMTVCPPQLLLYPSPVIVSPENITEMSSVARGSVERKRRTRRSLSADKHRSLDRAIRAARRMKHTSGHMAHSLAEGLQYQELLTQS